MKARRVGDLITVIINESASASKEASTGTSRGSSISAGIPNLLGLETQLTGMKQWINADKLVSANYDSSFAGKGATSRKESLNATVAAVVVQVYSNGTLKIEGRRSVKVNGEEQMIVLEGVARARDITPENTISSAYLADAKINYSGKGVISDRQEPGFLMWIIDSLWPF
jgi:flagellar L-ring protein precursor FlgH